MNSKCILITGSNGLLGSALVKVLSPTYNIVSHTRADADLQDGFSTSAYLWEMKMEYGVDTIIHTAAEVGGVLKNTQNREKMFVNNLNINNNVFKGAYDAEIKQFVNILSTCIFPSPGEYPLTPNQMYRREPDKSAYGYAMAKRLSASTVDKYHEVLGWNWINVIPTNIYGPGDNFNPDNSHVLANLINKAYNSSKTGEDFIIWGDGSPLRQFIFSEDLAKVIKEHIIEAPFNFSPIMTVNPTEYSITDVAFLIAKKFGIESDKIRFDSAKPSGIARMTASTNIPFFEWTTLSDGLDKTIDWYINNLNKIRK